MKKINILAIIILMVSSVSCIGPLLNPDRSLFGGDKATIAGTSQMIEPEKKFNKFNLIKLLCPSDPEINDGNNDNYAAKLPLAINCFYNQSNQNQDQATQTQTQNKAQDEEKAKNLQRKRNELQGVLLAASDQKCDYYKKSLWRFFSTSNFLLGSASTILGGLGAIFTNETAIRSLAGAAGITSGVRGELQQNFLTAATDVITKGINKRRKNQCEKIIEKQSFGIDAYPVMIAIMDSIEYNSSCSVMVGLAEAGLSLDQISNPGIDIMLETITKAGKLNQALTDALPKDPEDEKETEKEDTKNKEKAKDTSNPKKPTNEEPPKKDVTKKPQDKKVENATNESKNPIIPYSCLQD